MGLCMRTCMMHAWPGLCTVHGAGVGAACTRIIAWSPSFHARAAVRSAFHAHARPFRGDKPRPALAHGMPWAHAAGWFAWVQSGRQSAHAVVPPPHLHGPRTHI